MARLADEKEVKTCYFCKGRVEKAQVRHVHRWGERIIVFEDVPAELCQQCGEVYLEPHVLEVMDHLTSVGAKPKATISVPVFSLAGVGSAS